MPILHLIFEKLKNCGRVLGKCCKLFFKIYVHLFGTITKFVEKKQSPSPPGDGGGRGRGEVSRLGLSALALGLHTASFFVSLFSIS